MQNRIVYSMYWLFSLLLIGLQAHAQALKIAPLGPVATADASFSLPSAPAQFQVVSASGGMKVSLPIGGRSIPLSIGSQVFTKATFKASSVASSILASLQRSAEGLQATDPGLRASPALKKAYADHLAITNNEYWKDVLLDNASSAQKTAFTNELTAGLLSEWGRLNEVAITGISPSSGPVGTVITIKGTNLSTAASITIGGVNATPFTVVGEDALRVTVPSGITTGKVVVADPQNGSANSDLFKLSVAPSITSFSPTSGREGTSVTITGTNLDNTPTLSFFNGKAATISAGGSATTLTATVPAGTTNGPLTITTSKGTVASATAFTLTNLTPSKAAVGDGDLMLHVFGTGFTNASRVSFGDEALDAPTAFTNTELTVKVKATLLKKSGEYIVSVTGAGTAGSAAAMVFTVVPPAPTVSKIEPAQGTVGTEITIAGTNLTNAEVSFNGTNATPTTSKEKEIKVKVPNGATSGPITVTTTGGTASSATDFTITPVTKSTANEPENTILNNPDFRIGFGAGVSWVMQDSYTYNLAPPDYRIQQQKDSRVWPVISTIICYSPSYYYINRSEADLPFSQQKATLSPGRISYLLAINVNSAFQSNLDFNQRLGLGLGIGRRIGKGNSFHVALFAEGTIRRFLRDNYQPFIGQAALPAYPITTTSTGNPPVSTTTPGVVTSLNLSDDIYFVSRPVFGIGFKFIYLITGGKPKIPTDTAEE